MSAGTFAFLAVLAAAVMVFFWVGRAVLRDLDGDGELGGTVLAAMAEDLEHTQEIRVIAAGETQMYVVPDPAALRRCGLWVRELPGGLACVRFPQRAVATRIGSRERVEMGRHVFVSLLQDGDAEGEWSLDVEQEAGTSLAS